MNHLTQQQFHVYRIKTLIFVSLIIQLTQHSSNTLVYRIKALISASLTIQHSSISFVYRIKFLIPALSNTFQMADLPVSLYEILSVFATMKVNQTVEKSPCIKKSSNNKHPKLLDGIALISVTVGTSDVAAVTLTNRMGDDGKITTCFYLAKNRDPTPAERTYYHELIELMNLGASHNLLDSLRTLILKNCRGKILSRLIKLQKAVNPVKESIATWGPPDLSAQSDAKLFLKCLRAPTLDGKSLDGKWADYLAAFLMHSLHPNAFQSSGSVFPIVLAYMFTRMERLMSLIRSPKVGKRLKKIADYWAIIKRLEVQALAHRVTRVYELIIVSRESIFLVMHEYSQCHSFPRSRESSCPLYHRP